jgi:single-strand DNA-binding protein
MSGYNQVVLLGNLTADPELRYTPNGTAVTDLRLAVNETRRGEEVTLFIDVTAWDKTAEACGQYISKGSQILVAGRLRQETWEDRDTGKKRSKISVTANTVQFLRSGDAQRGTRPQNTRPSAGESDGPPF